jgi:hypothetical protein
MAWTYDGNPSSSDKNEVRFLIGDTDPLDPLLQDEEIEFLIADEGSARKAAPVAAEAISAKFSRMADEKVGQVEKDFSQLAEAYRKLAADLRRRFALRALAKPYAGGISKADKAIDESSDDRVHPAFERDMHENPAIDGFGSRKDLLGCR